MFKKLVDWLFPPRKEPEIVNVKPTIKLSPYQKIMVNKIKKEKLKNSTHRYTNG